MTRIKYSADIMQYISIFESFTNAKVKDCIVDESVLFVIEENDMGKAIGKHGSNIKRMEELIKKSIRLVEFSNNPAQFLQNLIYPTQAKDIREENKLLSIYCHDAKSKGRIIGRERQNLQKINDIVKRYFDVEEVKVV